MGPETSSVVLLYRLKLNNPQWRVLATFVLLYNGEEQLSVQRRRDDNNSRMEDQPRSRSTTPRWCPSPNCHQICKWQSFTDSFQVSKLSKM